MPDITVASTTDTEEDVKAAAGLSAEGEKPKEEAASEEETPKEEAKSEKASPEGDEKLPKTASESESEKSEEEEEEQGKKGKTAFQKRIDKLTERNYELRDANRELHDRLSRLETAMAGKKEPEAKEEVKQDVKPERKGFKTDEEFYEALGRWGARQEVKTSRAEEAKQASDEDLQVIFSNYNEGVTEFRTDHPDYDDVVGDTSLQIPMAVQNAIISYEQEGPALAYYLATHKDFVDKLDKHNDVRAVAEIGKLHLKLFPEEAKSNTEVKPVKAEADEKPPEAKPVVKRAPAPAKPERAASSANAIPIDELPYSEYRKVRDQQERGRTRR